MTHGIEIFCVGENSLAFIVVSTWELMLLLDQRLQELPLLRDWRCSKLGQTAWWGYGVEVGFAYMQADTAQGESKEIQYLGSDWLQGFIYIGAKVDRVFCNGLERSLFHRHTWLNLKISEDKRKISSFL